MNDHVQEDLRVSQLFLEFLDFLLLYLSLWVMHETERRCERLSVLVGTIPLLNDLSSGVRVGVCSLVADVCCILTTSSSD